MGAIILGFSAVVFFLVGVIALGSIKSDIQVIVAVLAFGFGFLNVGVLTIVGRLDALKKASTQG